MGLADMTGAWAMAAPGGRIAVADFLLRLASALLTPKSIFPSGGLMLDLREGLLTVFLRCEHDRTGAAAWDCAGKAVLACFGGDDQLASFKAAFAMFLRVAHRHSADIITAAVAREARRLDIPWYRLRNPGQLVQIGQGTHRRYLFDATSNATGAISSMMSGDKMLTNRILGAVGVPVLPMIEVSSESAAIRAAERIGYPVVVKPCHGGRGRGVSVHLTGPDRVRAAFRLAFSGQDTVLVEKFAAGDDHRALILGGRVIAVVRRMPPQVTGDGRQSIAALVEQLNQDPRRSGRHDDLLYRVEIDDMVRAVLAEEGLTPESIPEAGRQVLLKRTANIATGGTAHDASTGIHPDNRAILERAAAALDLVEAGIDFMIPDIRRSWKETGGVVVEVNSFAGMRPHWVGQPDRNVVEPIIRSLLPPGGDGRIPTCAITGSLGKTTTANMVARILQTMGLVVGRGRCTTTGVRVGEERQRAGDCASGYHARNLLIDRRVEAGVFELARCGLLNEGMNIEDCDVGAILNIRDNHLGWEGATSRGDLARIKSIVARRARHVLVLNAEDPLCLEMRQSARAKRVFLVAQDGESAALSEHLAAGGGAVTLRTAPGGAQIMLTEHGTGRAVIDPSMIPATMGGQHDGKVWNALFAVAIAYAMGASPDQIRLGLSSFKPDMADSQGRFSVVDRHPFRVILDHGFSPEAMAELASAVRRMPVTGRRLAYVMASGRMRDELIRSVGRALSGAFDHYVCTNWDSRPGKERETVPDLLRDGIVAGGVPADAVVCIPGEEDALRYILGAAGAGDVVAMNTAETDRAIAVIESFGADRDGSAMAPSPVR